MRCFKTGEPFMDVKAEYPDGSWPVFSEAFLYDRMCKDDARFILAVAEEYEELIRVLGTAKIRQLLGKD